MLSLFELNEKAKWAKKTIDDFEKSYRREEWIGRHRIQWSIGRTDYLDMFGDIANSQFTPILIVVTDKLPLMVERIPGVCISRLGEIKTAIELWIAGAGPWPEPREATMETIPEPPPVLPPAPPPPPPERKTTVSMRI